MGRIRSCRPKEGEMNNKGAWTAGEDKLLIDYIQTHGEGRWRNVSRETGLKRCGKSCRLRWLNYLRPDIKRGNFSIDEDDLIFRLHRLLGNRWSLIAKRLPGRTDNEVKNYWNSYLSKKQKSILQKASKNLSQFAFPAIIADEPPDTYSAIPEDRTAPGGFNSVQNDAEEEAELSPGSSSLDLTISFDMEDFIFPELFDSEFDGELCDLDGYDGNKAAADKTGTSETSYTLADCIPEKETGKNRSGGECMVREAGSDIRCWAAEPVEDWIV